MQICYTPKYNIYGIAVEIRLRNWISVQIMYIKITFVLYIVHKSSLIVFKVFFFRALFCTAGAQRPYTHIRSCVQLKSEKKIVC